MKVLIIGSGGREHALAWKLRQSPRLTELYIAPGNPGSAELGTNVGLKVTDLPGLVAFAKEKKIDLTIVGPELPLSLGVVDTFKAAGLRVFGPTREAAQLETSKAFAKRVMERAGVRTAGVTYLSSSNEAKAYIEKHPAPYVFKADGLAAGKGVFVCQNKDEALAALPALFDELKADTVLAEEFLSGVEASLIVATDGTRIVPLAAAHDHKRLRDNHQGPNTGGMGTVSPTSHLSQAQERQAIEKVIKPVLAQMRNDGVPFSGFLYAGLMISERGEISVVEFNARMGDPECQVIMRRLASDILEIFLALTDSDGADIECSWHSQAAVCIVLAAEGYPGEVKKGDLIEGIEFANSLPGVVVFHAGTALNQRGGVITSGGRVLNVTALGVDIAQARSRAYRGCDMIQFRGQQLRRDIGL